MKISTKGRYALRMLIDLAEHQGDGFIALKLFLFSINPIFSGLTGDSRVDTVLQNHQKNIQSEKFLD